MITGQMTPFSLLLFGFYPLVYYISAFTFRIQFNGVPPLHFVLVCKIHIHMSKITLSSLLMYSFFCIKFANFWYIPCFVHNLISNWPWSHGHIKNHFMPLGSFYTTWKYQKIRRIGMISGMYWKRYMTWNALTNIVLKSARTYI